MTKIAHHRDKIAAYLAGEPIFPVTLELDLTTACTLSCPECPSSAATQHHTLTWAFVDRLLAILGGRTEGILLTGGEPTLAPLFPATLRSARTRGFKEIAVVTNGSLLDMPRVLDALLVNATTIRISLYGWELGDEARLNVVLSRVERIRKQIDREGSELRIGMSALTSTTRVERLRSVAASAAAAGAHWLYFHPLCTRWGLGSPVLDNQSGVLDTIESIQQELKEELEVHTFDERYADWPIEFEAYHAAHFLLVIGADGNNYLGPEVKYQHEQVISSLNGNWDSDFLQQPDRLKRITSVRSRGYSALSSRHRGLLYNHFIECLRSGRPTGSSATNRQIDSCFRFPHIL